MTPPLSRPIPTARIGPDVTMLAQIFVPFLFCFVSISGALQICRVSSRPHKSHADNGRLRALRIYGTRMWPAPHSALATPR